MKVNFIRGNVKFSLTLADGSQRITHEKRTIIIIIIKKIENFGF